MSIDISKKNTEEMMQLALFLIDLYQQKDRAKALELIKECVDITKIVKNWDSLESDDFEGIAHVWLDIIFPETEKAIEKVRLALKIFKNENVAVAEEEEEEAKAESLLNLLKKAGLAILAWQAGVITVTDLIDEWIDGIDTTDKTELKRQAINWVVDVLFLKSKIKEILSLDISLISGKKLLHLAIFLVALTRLQGKAEALELLEKVVSSEYVEFETIGRTWISIVFDSKLDQYEKTKKLVESIDESDKKKNEKLMAMVELNQKMGGLRATELVVVESDNKTAVASKKND